VQNHSALCLRPHTKPHHVISSDPYDEPLCSTPSNSRRTNLVAPSLPLHWSVSLPKAGVTKQSVFFLPVPSFQPSAKQTCNPKEHPNLTRRTHHRIQVAHTQSRPTTGTQLRPTAGTQFAVQACQLGQQPMDSWSGFERSHGKATLQSGPAWYRRNSNESRPVSKGSFERSQSKAMLQLVPARIITAILARIKIAANPARI